MRNEHAFHSESHGRSLRRGGQRFGGGGVLVAVLSTYIVLHYILLAISPKYLPSRLDEIAALLMLPLAGYYAVQRRDFMPPILFCAYAIFLYIGAVFSGYGGVIQPNASILAIMLDAKILIFAMALSGMFSWSTDILKPMRVLSLLIIVIAILNSPFVFLDIVRGVDIHGAPLLAKGGFPQPRGLFHHPTELAWLYVFAAFSAACLYQERRSPQTLILVAIFGVFVVATVSIKEIAALGVGLVLILRREGGGRAALPLKFAALLIIGTLLVLTTDFGAAVIKHVGMFVGDRAIPTVRAGMTEASWRIASDHFPLGSGGGTFGSAPSYQGGYSNVYYAYNIHILHGGSREFSAFLQDVFWPKVLGESGWAGFLCYLGFLWVFIRRAIARFSDPKCAGDVWLRLSVAILALVFLVSFASSPFTNELLLLMSSVAFGYAGRKLVASDRGGRRVGGWALSRGAVA